MISTGATQKIEAKENSITEQVSVTANEISATNIKQKLSQFMVFKFREDPMAKLIHDVKESIKDHEKGSRKIEQTLQREIGRIKGNNSILYKIISSE